MVTSAAPPLTEPTDHWLRFRWSYQSQAELSSGGSPTVLPSATSPLLSVDPTLLRAGESYVFLLRVTDADPTHVHPLTGVAPASQLNFSVLVTEPPRQEVQTTEHTNPCAGSTLCHNGGACLYEEVVGDGGGVGATYSLSCQCPSSPYAFFGAQCSFTVLSCPSCVSPFVGGASLRLYGVGLDSLFRISVAQRPALFEPAIRLNATTLDSEQKQMWNKFGLSYPDMQSMTLITPALVQRQSNATVDPFLHPFARGGRRLFDSSAGSDVLTNPPSAYQMLTLESVFLAGGGGSSSFVQVNYSRLLLYSSSSCGVDVWKEDGLGGCLPCPPGGVCMGGGRVWPLFGYWSYSEWTAPVRCAVEEACPGVDADANGMDSDAFMNTQRYSGARCADCAEGYYQLQSRCYFCGSSVDQSASIALTVIVGFAVMCLMAAAAATLPAKQLARAVQLFTNLQAVALVGVAGAKHSPFFGEELNSLFTYVNSSQSHRMQQACA
jgi:hypothetical protein